MLKKDFLYSLVTRGTITVGMTGSAVAPLDGTIRFNDTTNEFEGWNGVEWVSFTSVGDLQYDSGEPYAYSLRTYTAAHSLFYYLPRE